MYRQLTTNFFLGGYYHKSIRVLRGDQVNFIVTQPNSPDQPPSVIDNKQSQKVIFIWRCRCWRWNSQLCLSFRTVAGPWLLERHWWWSHHDNAGEFSGRNRLVPPGENRFVIFKVVCPKWQVSTGRSLWWCNERTTRAKIFVFILAAFERSILS